jgi:hypothetical protein
MHFRIANLEGGHYGQQGLAKHALTLLGSVPDMELPEVLADKLPG